MSRRIFESVQMPRPRMSGFDLSHERKLSCNAGELIPCFVQEVIPSDHFNVETEVMVRVAPLLAPMMHRVNVFVHYFFVPNRIVWDQWEEFISGGREGTSTAVLPMRTIEALKDDIGAFEGTLLDYMGLPSVADSAVDPAIKVSELPLRAYHQIYNDYFIDSNLKDAVDYTDITKLTRMRNRSWEKDYFTSCLPWAQRGAQATINGEVNYMSNSSWYKDDGVTNATNVANITGGVEGKTLIDFVTGGIQPAQLHNIDSISFDINDFRRTSALQRWLEKNALGGWRYNEILLSHFGVRSSDARLQRAEYLGGGRQPLTISEVLNTTGTATAPQGDMTGHGISVGETNHFNYQVEEHGYIIGILSIMPRSNYQQGIPKHFLREDRTDFVWPEFANIGEQVVQNMEIFYSQDESTQNTDTFGYQQRYAEMKYGMSTIHGEFRSSLDYWHWGRIFDFLPVLNNTWMTKEPSERPFATQDGSHKFWVQMYHHVKARRPLPYFANYKLS